ncbi:hypothetical protein F5Y07DRAFT_344460 [Xylaria sp. FL0933]|nr:hypothetical protein F5Y07DRAFT_344460 [Xylaria sp. FL0933]
MSDYRLSSRHRHCASSPYASIGLVRGEPDEAVLSSSSPSPQTDDDANLVVLRKDLHFLFDQRRLVLVPKAGPWPSTDTSGGLGSTDEQTAISSPQSDSIHSFDQPIYLSTHVLLPDMAGELTNLYHNRLLQRSFTSSDMAPEFLFARFAWAILSDEFYRLLQTDLFKYRVLIFDPKTAKHEEQDLGRKALDKTVNLFPRGSCSRSISPKKRRMPLVEDEEDSADSGESDASDESESCRGRWRWRPGDSFRA